MKAICMYRYGDPDVLIMEDIPRPNPSLGEVLIRVQAIGINPVDWKTRRGRGMANRIGYLPLILGWDVAGVIEAVGPGVINFQVGDPVFGLIRLPAEGKAYAEYTTAPATEIMHQPKTLDAIHAAAIPLVALTAWQALFERALLTTAQRVLIHAAAGGVGHVAVQLAQAKGAEVIAVTSSSTVSFLQELGVNQVINREEVPFEILGSTLDVVLDPLGGEIQTRSLKVLKPGGYLVSLVAEPAPALLARYGVSGSRILVYPNVSQLIEISHLIDSGQIRPVVSRVVGFTEADIRMAHAWSEAGHTRGKIVARLS